MTKKIVRELMKANGVRIGHIPASYKVMNSDTEEFYLGSTKNITGRIQKHKTNLLKGVHPNKDLQKSFDNAPNKSVFIVEVFPTATVTEALSNEQIALNGEYLNDKCLNIKPSCISADTQRTVTPNPLNIKSEKHKQFIESKRILTSEEEDQRRAKIAVTSADRWNDQTYRNNHIAALGDKVTIDGIVYNSVREACRAHGNLAPQTLRAKMKLGVDIKSSDLRRDNFKKVSVNGVVYNSVSEAATTLGIATNTLTWRCQNTDPKWSGFFYVT
jgi:hypothetical protein